jgi:hypothetical protein
MKLKHSSTVLTERLSLSLRSCALPFFFLFCFVLILLRYSIRLSHATTKYSMSSYSKRVTTQSVNLFIVYSQTIADISIYCKANKKERKRAKTRVNKIIIIITTKIAIEEIN